MFESLKKKLKSFLGVPEKKSKKSNSKKEKPIKAKSKKERKSKVKSISSKKSSKESKHPILEQEAQLQGPLVKPVEKAEEIKEEPEQKIEQVEKEKKGFFSRFTERFISSKITKPQVEEIFAELEIILLENNVALEVVDKIKSILFDKLVNKEAKKSQLQEKVIKSLKEAISDVLKDPPNLLDLIKSKSEPYVILFFGINGSGKTTSLAKTASYLKQNNISCVLAAGDTFRAASIEQLETHASRLSVPIIKSQYGADPSSVAFDAINYAKKHHIKAVLIDTAGRMYTKENLMKEMEKIVRVSKPDLKLFVGEAITGNDATEQARTFNDSVGIDGIILTKADVDDKGGASLSVSQVTGKPIFFLGVGQNYEDLKPFNKQEIIKSLGLD